MEPYPKGTKLADVPPDFRGMTLAEYLAECRMFEQGRADKHRETAEWKRIMENQKWKKRQIK